MHYIASFLVNSKTLATLAFSETIVDRSAVDAAIAAGNVAEAQRLLSSGKVESRTRILQAEPTLEAMAKFASKQMRIEKLHIVPVSASPDCNVFAVALGEKPAVAAPSKGK